MKTLEKNFIESTLFKKHSLKTILDAFLFQKNERWKVLIAQGSQHFEFKVISNA